MVTIWVIVGGKATLIGPIAGTVAVQYLTTWLGTQGVGQVNLILGLILMVFVLAFQQGLLPSVGMVLGMARELGLTPPTMDQPQYNMFERDKVERDFHRQYNLKHYLENNQKHLTHLYSYP